MAGLNKIWMPTGERHTLMARGISQCMPTSNSLTTHDSVTIRCEEDELSETARLVGWSGSHQSAACYEFLIEVIYAFDFPIGEVQMIAKLPGWLDAGTFAQHQSKAVTGEKTPASCVDWIFAKPEDIDMQCCLAVNADRPSGTARIEAAVMLKLFLFSILFALVQPALSAQSKVLCTAELRIIWTDMFGGVVPPLDHFSEKMWLEIQDGPSKESRVDLKLPIILPCGSYVMKSDMAGFLSETFSVKLTKGLNTVTVGRRVGSLWDEPQSVVSGVWEGSRCQPGVVRAISLYGLSGPIFSRVDSEGRFLFLDLPDGKFALVLISLSGDCSEKPRIATVRGGSLQFDR